MALIAFTSAEALADVYGQPQTRMKNPELVAGGITVAGLGFVGATVASLFLVGATQSCISPPCNWDFYDEVTVPIIVTGGVMMVAGIVMIVIGAKTVPIQRPNFTVNGLTFRF